MLNFITKNFLALSSFVVVLASAISLLFLIAYLGVFDWNLIWLIEYGDLTKFFLIGAALILSVMATISYWFQDIHTWLIAKAPNQKWFMILMFVLVVPFPSILLYLD
jgi:voltage-gated potassium channel Kch